MNSNQKRRMWMVVGLLIFATLIIVGRLVAFQIIQGPEWAERASDEVLVVAKPERGTIYDRNGATLAANTADYQIGVSPQLVTEADLLATALAPILQESRYEILGTLQSDQAFILLASRVSAEAADLIRALPYEGLQIDPLPRRFYPQEEMLCHLLGYVDFDGNGGSGIEGYYQRELAGEAASAVINISPLTSQQSVIAHEGADLTLTIDRSLQYTVETHLRDALAEYRAVSGSIIVMNPKTGAILAMASAPCYSPAEFYETNPSLLLNPAVSQQHEPGSVMKLITMAAALDSGVVTPQSTYYDAGILEVGGHKTYNWDRSAPGTTDMTTLLARSLNVGAATLSQMMGPDVYYDYLQRFGFGRPTGVDLMSEAAGQMPLPGDALWTESFMSTNAYGQSIAVTPLQMITAVSALANNGIMMQPYIVQEIQGDSGTFVHEPTVLGRPISPETAAQVNAMAITAVAREVDEAQIFGYTIAGKTGTAQIAENGIYLPDDVIGSFIGWLPAENPELIIYVKIDRPQTAPWGSQTAAPAFAHLADELVVMLDVPPDSIRLRADVMAARQDQ
ncbi:Cell division protein FtsI [Peptidoglycan synthetase] @ Sporulation peptidoglycan synthetase SpoVD [hydrothermal vent metagenome]|uniref:Cell division protein FtsI [Peptidoglycan synthetase] @ Sporulation peptidoglycan synthetase SpoVD n=1 Tax=hydrothermal vent metagenome TaxID=652676 RepID=A0A3B0VEC9_9ZZZZ